MSRSNLCIVLWIASLTACAREAVPDLTPDPGPEDLADEVSEIADTESGQPDITSETTDVASETTDTELEQDTEPWTPPDDPLAWPILPIRIELGPLERALLESNPQSPVVTTVTLATDAPITARISLSGAERFDTKPNLVIRFGRDTAEVHHGTDGLVLDAMNDDPSQMRERLVHLLAARAGLVVPRATHAQLDLTDADSSVALGLYTVREPITSPEFLTRATGTNSQNGQSGSVFTTRDRNDLWPWQIVDYLRLDGDEADRAGLSALADAMETFRLARLQGSPIALRDTLGDRLDLDAFVDAMAFQTALGHWGGYARSTLGFALHVASGEPARITFLPVALGRSLTAGDAPNPWLGGGKLLGHCRDDRACRTAYGEALARHATPAAARDMVTIASSLRLTLGPALAADTRRASALAEVRVAQDELLWVLEQQSGWVGENLACTHPEDVDQDGDGFSVCLDDCDDDRDDVYPGAKERCNLRDDDCDGVLDNDPACPDCLAVDGPRQGQTWHICYAPRTWAQARARCHELGGELASITNEAEHTAYLRATLGLHWTSWWLGLSDQAEEGTFVWSDGEPATFTRWSSGEPNDAGGREDCAQLVPWSGRWNDIDCARRLPFVCQHP